MGILTIIVVVVFAIAIMVILSFLCALCLTHPENVEQTNAPHLINTV